MDDVTNIVLDRFAVQLGYLTSTLISVIEDEESVAAFAARGVSLGELKETLGQLRKLRDVWYNEAQPT